MKFFCIGDADTVAGFRLAGIAGQVTETPKETKSAMDSARTRPACGVIIITEQLADSIRDTIEAMRLERKGPLVVEIPGPGGPMAGRKSLREFVQEALGVRI